MLIAVGLFAVAGASRRRRGQSSASALAPA
nr:hypothetical protein [Candidatus Accumulibacter vicinus]